MNYETITANQAKEMMKDQADVIILDVRTQAEYSEGHVPNAILLPYDEITHKAKSLLPDIDSTILVYCRSGQRSAIASTQLAALGYTHIYNFGGIKNWPYEITK